MDVGISGLRSFADGAKNLTGGAVEGLNRLRGNKRSDADGDVRAQKADETFKRMFKMMDYNRDHSLRVGELKAGLQVLQHAWEEFGKLCKSRCPLGRLLP